MAKFIVAALQGYGIYLWSLLVFDDGQSVPLRLSALIMVSFYTFATLWWLGRK